MTQGDETLLMKALRREETPRPPIWLMRQAGRYMAEYRAVREKVSFLELCMNPKLCADVMATAVDRLGVDAAIIFSDLLPILIPLGFDLEYSAGDGPVIRNPFRGVGDLARVPESGDLSRLNFVFETVSETRRVIPSDKPVIGFAGAPWTLAGYAIEGGTSRNFLETKRLMRGEEAIWNEFLTRLTRLTVRYLNAQIAAGAQTVQIFDSWVGVLGEGDYRRYVLPHVRRLIAAITPGVPVIYFGTGNPALLPAMAESGASCLGVDWRIPLVKAWELIGEDYAVQGNLDPSVLLSDKETIIRQVNRLLQSVGDRPGFIFNLGHGVLKETPVENVITLVETVKGASCAR